jgi:hypothetical protein
MQSGSRAMIDGAIELLEQGRDLLTQMDGDTFLRTLPNPKL